MCAVHHVLCCAGAGVVAVPDGHQQEGLPAAARHAKCALSSMVFHASLICVTGGGESSRYGKVTASMGRIIRKAKWEILTHVLSISTSLYVASKYSSIPPVTFSNLETLLLCAALPCHASHDRATGTSTTSSRRLAWR